MFGTSQLIAAVGIALIIGCCWAISSGRRNVPWRSVYWGFAVQCVLAILLLAFPPSVSAFQSFGDAVTWFLGFAAQGASFLFGNLASSAAQPLVGFQFAITIFSVIVFFSSCMAVLYHYGVMQFIVRTAGRLLQKTMRTGPIESINAVGQIFLGQTEAPLLVRHYVGTVPSSELFAMMVGGFATIAGSTMGVYVARGINATDLMIASILAAPCALALAKIAQPATQTATNNTSPATLDPVIPSGNLLDAIAHGALDGAKLALNVIAVLVAFKAIIAFSDALLGLSASQLSQWGWQGAPTSLEQILGWIFLPFAWLMGIPQNEAQTVASLLGTKIAMTEFIAYDRLATMIADKSLSVRTVRLTTIALCGFANVMSIGIQIGGYGMMAPNRRAEVAKFGIKAMCVGALANICTACVAGILIPDEPS